LPHGWPRPSECGSDCQDSGHRQCSWYWPQGTIGGGYLAGPFVKVDLTGARIKQVTISDVGNYAPYVKAMAAWRFD
jgi:hypothetical protein